MSRSRSGGRRDRDLGAGPGDPAVAALVGADHRPVDLEVVELLGVDGADDARASQTAIRWSTTDGGGVGGVVPALERGDDDGVDQAGTSSISITPSA